MASDEELVGQLEQVWASMAAPHQFILARRHVSDPRTEQLLSKIRGVCIYLNNEVGDPKTPLALTKPSAEWPQGCKSLSNIICELYQMSNRSLGEPTFA